MRENSTFLGFSAYILYKCINFQNYHFTFSSLTNDNKLLIKNGKIYKEGISFQTITFKLSVESECKVYFYFYLSIV